MTTYYYGNIEFGRFVPTSVPSDGIPMAIIHRVDVVKEFDTPQEAWHFYTDADGAYESYVSLDAKDADDVQYELVFKQHR
jgi:hypothetical protein